jgi:hypothetical protein
MSNRREWSTKPDYVAFCDTCGWKLSSRNALGAAAIHARKHKHYVHVDVYKSVIYNHREEKPVPG